jgi:hypothetical protein
MRISICEKLLLAVACMGLGLPLWAQKSSPETSSGLEVTVLYNALLTNVVRADNFWMQSGSIQVNGQFWRGLGVAADISGSHTQNAGVGLDIVTATFGPHYRWSPAHQRYALFGQALAGEAFGLNSIFPGASAATGSVNSLALEIGGGMDLPVAHRLSLRPFEADWLRTQLPNSDTSVQNNVRVAAGIVVRFQ